VEAPDARAVAELVARVAAIIEEAS
jgi:hypothetical protein